MDRFQETYLITLLYFRCVEEYRGDECMDLVTSGLDVTEDPGSTGGGLSSSTLLMIVLLVVIPLLVLVVVLYLVMDRRRRIRRAASKQSSLYQPRYTYTNSFWRT